MNNIIQNALQTPDGTIIISRNVHDYAEHDGYFVDGGHDYCRYGFLPGCEDKYTPLFLFENDTFEKKKNNLVWGTYGKDGNQPLKWVKFIDCTDEHLEAILKHKNLTLKPLYKKVIKSIQLDRLLILRKEKINKIIDNVQSIPR